MPSRFCSRFSFHLSPCAADYQTSPWPQKRSPTTNIRLNISKKSSLMILVVASSLLPLLRSQPSFASWIGIYCPSSLSSILFLSSIDQILAMRN